jgi:hypothetical protein
MRLVGIVLCACALGGCSGDCATDSDCGNGQVCARTGDCEDTSDVHAVRITWTVHGQPASTAACTGFEDLVVRFQDSTYDTKYDDTTGYLPVPCAAGVFPVDKLERSYVTALLGIDPDSGDSDDDFANPTDPQSAEIPDDGDVAFDLP